MPADTGNANEVLGKNIDRNTAMSITFILIEAAMMSPPLSKLTFVPIAKWAPVETVNVVWIAIGVSSVSLPPVGFTCGLPRGSDELGEEMLDPGCRGAPTAGRRIPSVGQPRSP